MTPGGADNPLFRPFQFGARLLPNRIAMAPMTRSRSPGGVPGPEVAAYYRRRAEGGAGLIISEGAEIPHKAASGYPDVPHLYGEAALAGWRNVIEGVHAAGAGFIPQLWHVGSVRRRDAAHPDVPPYGPSAVVHPMYAGKAKAETPHAITDEDVDDLVAAYARAAANLKEIGADGVEIHGAHGYLIDQFMWPATNLRSDRFGGSLERRVQFAKEVVAGVRRSVGPDFPIVFRFSQWKQGDYEFKVAKTPEELGRWLGALVDAGVDILHASTRRFWLPEFEGSDLNLAGWAKKLTGKPAITVGSVSLELDMMATWAGQTSAPRRLDDLYARMARGEFDLVAVGRALLANPDWGNKVRDGKEADLRPFEPASLAELV